MEDILKNGNFKQFKAFLNSRYENRKRIPVEKLSSEKKRKYLDAMIESNEGENRITFGVGDYNEERYRYRKNLVIANDILYDIKTIPKKKSTPKTILELPKKEMSKKSKYYYAHPSADIDKEIDKLTKQVFKQQGVKRAKAEEYYRVKRKVADEYIKTQLAFSKPLMKFFKGIENLKKYGPEQKMKSYSTSIYKAPAQRMRNLQAYEYKAPMETMKQFKDKLTKYGPIQKMKNYSASLPYKISPAKVKECKKIIAQDKLNKKVKAATGTRRKLVEYQKQSKTTATATKSLRQRYRDAIKFYKPKALIGDKTALKKLKEARSKLAALNKKKK